MIITYALVASLLVVTGQLFWKKALQSAEIENMLSIEAITQIITQPNFWIGSVFYGIAVFAYLTLLSKFTFSESQVIFITLSVIFSLLASALFFNETIASVQMIGAGVIILGIFLFLQGASG